MTFVPERFSVGYKGHFLRWRVQYVMHAYLFMHIFIRHMPRPKIQIHFENYAEIQKSTLKSRNPLWNPEIHFEIQKSTWNTEIQSEIRNPREIQWISKSRTLRRAVADPSVQLNALWVWPEMTSNVNMNGGAKHNSKHLLIASLLVIKLIQNLLQYSLKSHGPSP